MIIVENYGGRLLRLYHLRTVSRLSPLSILNAIFRTFHIEHCYFLSFLIF